MSAKEFPIRVRIIMLVLNFVPQVHLSLVAFIILWFKPGLLFSSLIALGGVYLFPPLCTRLILCLRPIRGSHISMTSPDFLTWWASLQLQIIFCRFPVLEEALRLVPGLYSLWLRLWGAKIGRLTYWAAGTLIMDRPFLQIGDDVLFGAGVRLSAHVIEQTKPGDQELLLGVIKIGSKCSIGGYSMLACGTVIEDGQALKAFSLSPPFSIWKDGRRHKEPQTP